MIDQRETIAATQANAEAGMQKNRNNKAFLYPPLSFMVLIMIGEAFFPVMLNLETMRDTEGNIPLEGWIYACTASLPYMALTIYWHTMTKEIANTFSHKPAGFIDSCKKSGKGLIVVLFIAFMSYKTYEVQRAVGQLATAPYVRQVVEAYEDMVADEDEEDTEYSDMRQEQRGFWTYIFPDNWEQLYSPNIIGLAGYQLSYVPLIASIVLAILMMQYYRALKMRSAYLYYKGIYDQCCALLAKQVQKEQLAQEIADLEANEIVMVQAAQAEAIRAYSQTLDKIATLTTDQALFDLSDRSELQENPQFKPVTDLVPINYSPEDLRPHLERCRASINSLRFYGTTDGQIIDINAKQEEKSNG